MFERIHVEQGSWQWLDFRRKSIGASDAPVIIGQSKFKTPFQLWQEKLGIKEHKPPCDYILEKGHEVEEIVRERYNQKYQLNMQPAVFRNGISHASLDGYDEGAAGAIEVKLATREDHHGVKMGNIPFQYMWQVVAQLNSAPIQWVDYCSYWLPKKDSKLTEGELFVHRTYFNKVTALIDIYIEAAKKFKSMVDNRVAPEYTDLDYVPITDEHVVELTEALSIAQLEHVELKNRIDCIKSEIQLRLDSEKYKRFQVGPMKVTRVDRKGGTDYKKLIEKLKLQESTVAQFKKPDTQYYKFTNSPDD